MKGGEWIWILVIAFGLIRLLMRAKKKKEEEGQLPPVPHSGRSAEPARRRADPLKSFIDSLTNRYEQNTMPVGRTPIPIKPEEVRPPTPRLRPPDVKPLHAMRQPPVRAKITPVDQGIESHFNFSMNPVIQGIIFSEIIGPPRGVGGGRRLPSDL